jgi:ribosomal protein S18 acetylase RimI-like enzyme
MASIEVTRTHLEILSPASLRPAASPGPAVDARRESCSVALYRYLYETVGRNYNWYERNAWTDEELTRYLSQSRVGVWVLRVDEEAAGYFELVRHDDGAVEIAYFGLAPAYLGRGLGKYLLSRAVEEAWGLGASRVWLHTCTQDHPSALPNYLARGFTAFRTETYLVADRRQEQSVDPPPGRVA